MKTQSTILRDVDIHTIKQITVTCDDFGVTQVSVLCDSGGQGRLIEPGERIVFEFKEKHRQRSSPLVE